MIVPQKPKPFQKDPIEILVTQSSFENGPLMIDKSDCYVKIVENIQIDFSSIPKKSDPFHLGIFAAIIIKNPRVVIDLNGKIIEMSKSYQKEQRFFSIIELDQTPFPTGKAGFKTLNLSPSDITIKNGTLGLSSHFGVHAAVAGSRLSFENLTIQEFEVSAISLSGPNDVNILNCHIGSYTVPLTTTDFVMFRDLEESLRKQGNVSSANKIKDIKEMHTKSLVRSDALVRCIVIVPRFNVAGIPDQFDKKIQNINLQNITFDTIEAEPIEIVGAAEYSSHDVIKDANGNIISLKDMQEGNIVSISQAQISPELSPNVRNALLNGKMFSPVHKKEGLDRRAHDLIQKASLFVRIDGANHVSLINLKGKKVISYGSRSASVGIMLNGCENVYMRHIAIEGVHIDGRILPNIDDQRPSSGFYVRSSHNLDISDLNYSEKKMCSVVMNGTSNVKLEKCKLNAPLTYDSCQSIHMK